MHIMNEWMNECPGPAGWFEYTHVARGCVGYWRRAGEGIMYYATGVPLENSKYS